MSASYYEKMFFVYILKSTADGSFYVGTTKNVSKRLHEHNTGTAKYTSGKKPYILMWFCCFKEEARAYDFEKYIKHGSGHAFVKRHLL